MIMDLGLTGEFKKPEDYEYKYRDLVNRKINIVG